jgi:CHAT domain-containing protein
VTERRVSRPLAIVGTRPPPLKALHRRLRVAAVLLGCGAACALANAAPPPTDTATARAAAIAATAPAPDTGAFRLAQARERDAESLKTLTTDGQLLLGRDRVRLPAYEYCNLAVAAAERGDFRDSIEAASRALVLAQQTDNGDLVALSKRDLAIAYGYAGDLDDAERYAKEALDSKPKDPAQVFAPANKVLGDVAVRRGDFQRAMQYYGRALETASARFRPLVFLSLTNTRIVAGDPTGARTALAQAGEPQTPALASMYRRIEGNLLLAEGKPQQAEQTFEAGLAATSADDPSYDRLWAHAGMGRAYLASGEAQHARTAYLAALDDSERIRARFRSDEFKTGLFADTQAVFEEAIALAVAAGDYLQAWQISERSRARALLDTVRNRVTTGVDAAQLTGPPLGLDDVRAVLTPNDALVEFHSLDSQLIVFVIRSDGLKGFTLPIPRKDLQRSVRDMRDAIVHRAPAALKLGSALDMQLIQPLGLRPQERLIVVPHDALHYLPFQALRESQDFLIQRHAIVVEPSAAIAVQLAGRNQSVGSSLVAFGNPQIAPSFALPGAEAEVTTIAPLFDEKQVFLRATATRENFRDNAQTGRVLHVATHAEADAVDPLHSRILLAPSLQPADGPSSLLAKDIYNLKFDKTALVTLSACETGLGRVERGDEITGFTRAFFYAGASSLIVSMWPVSDASTSQMMRTFYTRLTEGAQAIDAMRDAQLAVLRTPRFAHPFFWAPFDLMGNWRLKIAPGALTQ